MRHTANQSVYLTEETRFKTHLLTQSIIVIIAISTASASTYAATAEATTSEPETTLPSLTFTTTATKTPTLIKNTIAQTTVIDEEQLQRYHGQSVIDVLRGQGGIYVTQNGGDGASSGVRLRGYSNSQVLVLIDGIRYSSATAGGAALSLLPVDQIDRIEIVYGASGSSLYGSDAMGGVIQIFTKGQNAQQSNVALTVGVGTQDNYKGQITGQLVNTATTLSLSTGYEKTNGIDATKPYAQFGMHHADKDGFESKNASLVAKHKVNDNVEIGATGLFAKSTTDIDSGSKVPNAYADQKNAAVSAFADYQQDKFSANIKYGQSYDKSTTYDGADWLTGRLDDVINTTQKQATIQLGYQLPLGKLIGGYENLKQEVDSSNHYDVTHRTINSEFLGYQLAQDKYDVQLNVRHDDNSQFDSKTTYNVGGAYRISPNTRIGASYSTNFRAPTFNDLYWQGSENPNLKPETSKNAEIFIENSNHHQHTRLTAYQSKFTDKLAWVTTDPLTYAGQMQNIDKADINGISLTSDWQLNNTLFGLGYDYLDTEDKKTGKELIYQPKNKGIVYLGYQQPKYDIRTELQHVGERYRDANNSRTLDSYTLLNLTGNYYVSPNLTISSRLNNIGNKDYETIYGYRQKGINSSISITYQWF